MQRKAGLCVDGKLEGKTARMIVDTGSNISIVTTQLLRNIVKDLSCVKPVPNCLRSVTGEKLNLLGTVTLKLKIGNREILQLFYVADINESCILGLCSYYRDSDAENAFQHLKCLLTNTPVLSFLCDEGTLVLDTDASGVAIVLFQHKNRVTKRKLSHISVVHLIVRNVSIVQQDENC